MDYTAALNYILGPLLIASLMFADFFRKYNADRSLRGIFLTLLVCTAAAMGVDAAHLLLRGLPGSGVRTALLWITTAYYFLQGLSYYYLILFVDHISFKDQKRTQVLTLYVWVVMIFHGTLLYLNTIDRFYFSVDKFNMIQNNRYFFILFIIDYAIIPIIALDLLIARIRYKNHQFFYVMFFVISTGGGAAMDLFFGTNIIWACFVTTLLYAYFFIIRSDARIDSLTGIGNRFSFNEFVDKLTKGGQKESWAIVMLDMDGFKQINDTLGHVEGDNALKDAAAIIKSTVRMDDFFARYGGDEFIIAVKAQTDVEAMMARIQQAMDAQNDAGTRPYNLKLSYGWAVYEANSGQSMNDFLKYIDRLMYIQKIKHRGGVIGPEALDRYNVIPLLDENGGFVS
jgi:diguanylate cyclase (GGDEF)-like protein